VPVPDGPVETGVSYHVAEREGNERTPSAIVVRKRLCPDGTIQAPLAGGGDRGGA
jgi:hypothetical protein